MLGSRRSDENANSGDKMAYTKYWTKCYRPKTFWSMQRGVSGVLFSVLHTKYSIHEHTHKKHTLNFFVDLLSVEAFFFNGTTNSM